MKEFAFVHQEGTRPDILRSVPFLSALNQHYLDELLRACTIIECEKGDQLYKEGDRDKRFYILLSGQLEICMGGTHIGVFTKPGEVIGELAVFELDRRIATIIANVKSVLLGVDQVFLREFINRKREPEFYAQFYEFIARVALAHYHRIARVMQSYIEGASVVPDI